jgi:hypothetical protein
MAKGMRSKWISLLNDLSWRGHTNWQQMHDSLIEEEIPNCKAWVKSRLSYVEEKDARWKQDVYRFYFLENTKFNSNQYAFKMFGVIYLAGMYTAEQDMHYD